MNIEQYIGHFNIYTSLLLEMIHHYPSPRHPEVNEADRMILWAEMDADNTGQVTKDEFEATGSPSVSPMGPMGCPETGEV